MTIIAYTFDQPDLDTNEFSLFNRVPDGTLTLEELQDNGKLEELISRLIKTDSVSITNAYIGTMSLALKFKIYDCLNEIVASPELQRQFGLDAQDLKRIGNWLKHDFALEGVAIDTTLNAQTDQSRSTTAIGFADADGNIWLGNETYNSSSYYTDPSAKFRYAHRVLGGDWLFKGALSTDFKPNATKQTDILIYTLPDGSTYRDPGSGTNEDVTKMLGGTANLSLSRIDDAASMYAGAWFGHKFDALPENYEGGWSAWAGGDVSQLFGTPLALDMSFEYSDDNYAPPKIEDRQTEDSDSLTAAASLSDQLTDDFGLSADYSLTQSDSINSYSTSSTLKHAFSGVGQFTLPHDHVVKSTLTGSWQIADASRTDRPQTTRSETASGRLKLSDDWKSSQNLQISASLAGAINSTKGSWNGIYSSFSQGLSYAWTPGNWSWQSGISGSENTWTLDYVPIEDGDFTDPGTYSATYLYGDLWTNLSYEPLTWLKIGTSGDIGKNAAWGYHPSDDFDYSGSGYVSARVLADPGALWLTVSASGSHSASLDEFDPGTDYRADSYSFNLSASFSDLRF